MGQIAQFMKANMKTVYYSPDHVNSCLLEISRQMYKDNFHPKCIVGLARGGLIPGVK